MAEPDPRRLVPRTDSVLADPRLVAAAERVGRARVKLSVTETLARVRAGELSADAAVTESIGALAGGPASLRRVINATGVVLHTNLGRAALSAAALDAVTTAAGFVDVEFDLATGTRARRGRDALDALLAAAPDAGAVHVVNNGAAALLLATTALAAGREVVISRGEMVEIGDGFRLPDLIRSTGAQLHEVGTTNRVSVEDYRAAIGERTGAVLKVHPSNFTITGFTHSVGVAELATLGPPLIVDVGSGLLSPDPLLPAEPDVRTALRDGADVVTCSGDKLLGGPQAGLLLGGRDVIDILRRHPLARALRVDKLTLAALEATLRGPQSPTWQALRADPAVLRQRCTDLARGLNEARVVRSAGVVGGGSAPGVQLAGWAVAVPAVLAGALRTGEPPVVGRVEGGRCLLDLRCVPPADDDVIAAALRRAADTRAR